MPQAARAWAARPLLLAARARNERTTEMSDRILNIMDSEVFRARREARRKLIVQIVMDWAVWLCLGVFCMLAALGLERVISWALR